MASDGSTQAARNKPDWQAARVFLEKITGQDDPRVTFQTFADKGDNPKLAGWRHGTVDECKRWIAERAWRGAGVFYMLNRGDGHGRRAKNVIACTAAHHCPSAGASSLT